MIAVLNFIVFYGGNMQKVIKPEQRANVIGMHTPREGAERSQWVKNQEKGYDGPNTHEHPVLSKTITGAADGLSPVATDPRNQETVQKALESPQNTPSLSATHQENIKLTTTMAPKPTPHN